MADPQTADYDADLQVLVYWNDLTLWQAAKYAADREDYWRSTMWVIRQAMSLSDDEFWNLTVSDHADLVAHLGLS